MRATKVCLCLTAPTIARNLELIEKYRSKIDLVELRVDMLNQDEQFHIRSFPELAGIPAILTVRRAIDGGKYEDGEGSRVVLLARGLSYADADPRKNFAYVDLEHDLNVPSIEEAARTFGVRIIRSLHDFQKTPEDLDGIMAALPHHADEIPKLAVKPNGIDDSLRIMKAAKKLEPGTFIMLGMGEYGMSTRILADSLGSLVTFTSPQADDAPLAAAGQLNPEALAGIYRFGQLKDDPELFGIVGYPLFGSRSPAIQNAAFSRAGINALYLPFPAESVESFFTTANFLSLGGFSVTIPYKEKVLPYMQSLSPEARAIGAVNTVIRTEHGWAGHNTDAPGFAKAARDFLGRKTLRGVRTTLIGAGGAARAIAYALRKEGAKAVILNRTPSRAMQLARLYGFKWSGMDARGLELLSRHSEFIVQSTSAGMTPEEDVDPIDFYDFEGHESVMDIIYKPAETKLLLRARMAGARTLNGFEMLKRQAELQFTLFSGRPFPA